MVKQNGAARLVAPPHAAGVGAVGSDDSTVRKTYVSQKTFVTLNKNSTEQPSRKAHGQVIAEVLIDS